MYLVKKKWNFLLNLKLFCLAPLNLENLLGLCYIDLHIRLVQTLLLIDSMLKLLQCINMCHMLCVLKSWISWLLQYL